RARAAPTRVARRPRATAPAATTRIRACRRDRRGRRRHAWRSQRWIATRRGVARRDHGRWGGRTRARGRSRRQSLDAIGRRGREIHRMVLTTRRLASLLRALAATSATAQVGRGFRGRAPVDTADRLNRGAVGFGGFAGQAGGPRPLLSGVAREWTRGQAAKRSRAL